MREDVSFLRAGRGELVTQSHGVNMCRWILWADWPLGILGELALGTQGGLRLQAQLAVAQGEAVLAAW